MNNFMNAFSHTCMYAKKVLIVIYISLYKTLYIYTYTNLNRYLPTFTEYTHTFIGITRNTNTHTYIQ